MEKSRTSRLSGGGGWRRGIRRRDRRCGDGRRCPAGAPAAPSRRSRAPYRVTCATASPPSVRRTHGHSWASCPAGAPAAPSRRSRAPYRV